MREPGSGQVREAMVADPVWVASRLTWIEVFRAIALGFGPASRQVADFSGEWPAFHVVAVSQALVDTAGRLAIQHGLRSLDAIHLASGLLVADSLLVFATWDARLHAAASDVGLTVLPERL